MTDSEKWDRHCGMTCIGGSEAKGCDCRGPGECEMRNDPGYDGARFVARQRMADAVRRIVKEGAGREPN